MTKVDGPVYPTDFLEALKSGWQVCWSRSLWRTKDKIYVFISHEDQKWDESAYFLEAPRWLVQLCDEERSCERHTLQRTIRGALGL